MFGKIVIAFLFSADELLINPKDFPGIAKGDVVELYHEEYR